MCLYGQRGSVLPVRSLVRCQCRSEVRFRPLSFSTLGVPEHSFLSTELDLSPTMATIGLPDSNSLGLEPAMTPRPAARSRQRGETSEQRDSSPEQDLSRTARASRVRSLGRSSGLAAALSASGEDQVRAKRRSRDLSSLTGLGVETKVLPASIPLSTTPTRSSGLSSSLASTAGSPPSPTSSLSISPASVSRRASVNLMSPPRSFQPGSPSTSRMSRGSLSGSHSGSFPIPLPFPAAPPPSESIKLQKVPESVRSALEFRQPSALSAAYLGEALSAPVSHGFLPSTSPTDLKIPKTPSATRAASPASPPSSSRSGASPSGSRGPSLGPSRQPSQELLSTSYLSPHNSAANSAFAPLFPFSAANAANAPVASTSTPTRGRDRAKSVAYLSSPSDPMNDLGALSGPLPVTQGVEHSPPTFNLSPFGTGNRITSEPHRGGHTRGSASISSIGGGGPSGRLAMHRTSIAPAGETDNSTDEYAQIILSTRNAKVRKWKTSGGSSLLSALEPGTAGTGKTWTGLGATTEDPDEEQDGEGEEGGEGQHHEPREIEWVDWLDEYRKLKEAKLAADQVEEGTDAEGDGDDEREEKEGGEKRSPKQTKQPSPPPSARRAEELKSLEPALTAAQKGKAKATSACSFSVLPSLSTELTHLSQQQPTITLSRARPPRFTAPPPHTLLPVSLSSKTTSR
jgi:hypothetical protein